MAKLKEQTKLTDSNLYICRNLNGEITSVYFLPFPDSHKIEDIKFNVVKNKITISVQMENKNEPKSIL